MKRVIILWAAGLMLAGVALWWGFQGDAQATHTNPNAGYSHFNFIGGRYEGIRDNAPERAGWDRNADRTPDGDGEGSATDRTTDGVPDCLAGPGDGTNTGGNANRIACGTPAGAADGVPDYFGMFDNNGPGTPLAEAPDYIAVFNRVGDQFSDDLPEQTGADRNHDQIADSTSDRTHDRVGTKDCVEAAECDRAAGVRDFLEDRAGREGQSLSQDGTSDSIPDQTHVGHDNPNRPARDRAGASGSGCDNGTCGDGLPDFTPSRVSDQFVAANRDNATTGPDGLQDRNLANNLRDTGKLLHTQAARDAFDTGPADRTEDAFMGGGNDRGGFGFGGGGGGCSLVAVRSASPASLAYLLVLLTPVALVVARRLRRR